MGINIFILQQQVTDELLEANIGQTDADSTSAYVDGNANTQLTYSWTANPCNTYTIKTEFVHGVPVQVPVFTNPVYQAFFTDVLQPMGTDCPIAFPGWTPTGSDSGAPTESSDGNLTNFRNFVQNYVLNPQYQNDLSDTFILQITSVLSNSNVWPNAKDTEDSPFASADLTSLTSVKSNIDALAGQEKQTGSTDINMIQSLLSQDGSNPSTLTASFNNVWQEYSTVNSILAQGV